MNTLQPILDFYKQPGRRWVQDTFDDGHGGHCIIGACNVITEMLYRIGVTNPLHDELNKRGARFIESFVCASVWNDAPGRTWEEVKDLLSQEDAA